MIINVLMFSTFDGYVMWLFFLLYMWYRNCTVKIVQITYVRVSDLYWNVLSSYYDKCLPQHAYHDRYLLTIIHFLITIFVFMLFVQFWVVAFMSTLTTPISKWDSTLTIHGM